jgi:polynucleotide 5'-hydroxyl-kinase GRC3/NOL9
VSLEVKEGEVSIGGGLRGKGEKVIIPRAKALPLEAETDALVGYTLGAEGKVERLRERTIPREWDELVENIAREKPRVILVEGDVDTGKTFFTTYIANRLLRHDIRVAVVDGDTGQSDIGPPSTVGLGILKRPVGLLHEVPTEAAHFIGSMSPSGHVMEFMIGMKKMVERGLEKADVTIVDTAGWISGGAGRALKLYEMELLNPDLIVALQRERELEHLLKGLPPAKVRRVPVSPKVRIRTHGERSFLRELILARHFEGASKLVLDLRKVKLERCYLGTGKPLDPEALGVKAPIVHAEKIPEGLLVVVDAELSPEVVQKLEAKFGPVKIIRKGSERNVLVGLADNKSELLGIGVIDGIDYDREKMAVITPVKEAGRIAVVQFGSMRITPSGKEVGTIRPGTF